MFFVRSIITCVNHSSFVITCQFQRNSHGNLENSLCAIDALPAGRIGGAKMQYKDVYLLRELNKAFTGFEQDKLQPVCTSPCQDLGREEGECQRAVSEEYYSAEEGLQCDEGMHGVNRL